MKTATATFVADSMEVEPVSNSANVRLPTLPPRSWLVPLGVAAVILAVIAYYFIDQPVALWVDALPSSAREPAKVLTELGVAAYHLWFFGIGAAVLWFLGRRVWSWNMLYVFCSIAVTGIVINLLKMVFGRYRPNPWLEDGSWGFNPFSPFDYDVASFPSGHAAVAMTIGVALMTLFPRAWVAWLAFGVVIGATRVFTLSHYVSDVIFGAYVGLAIAVLLRVPLPEKCKSLAWGARGRAPD